MKYSNKESGIKKKEITRNKGNKREIKLTERGKGEVACLILALKKKHALLTNKDQTNRE